MGELDIQVRVAGGKLFLTGTVMSEERRRAATALVERLVPGAVVCNDLTVVAPIEEPGVERLT